MLYVLSAQIVPINHWGKRGGALVELIPLGVGEAKRLLEQEPFTSAVGHAGTAEVMTSLLGVSIPQQRLEVFLQPGDKAIQFILARRQPEGVILDREAVERIGYSLTLVRRIE